MLSLKDSIREYVVYGESYSVIHKDVYLWIQAVEENARTGKRIKHIFISDSHFKKDDKFLFRILTNLTKEYDVVLYVYKEED